MECLPMSAEFPAHVPFYLARMIVSDFVSDYLDEFSIAPKNKEIQQYVFDAYEGLKCTKSYTFLIQLTPEEAFNTVSARSMETYKAPTTKRKLDEADATNAEDDDGVGEDQLGYAPRTSFEQGLAQTYEWYTSR